MNIFGHIISDTEIVGIGPLMVNTFNSQLDQLYGTRQYFFDVYLRGHAVRVQSDIFYPEAAVDEVKKQETIAMMNAWKSKYNNCRGAIADLLNEKSVQIN